MDTTLTMDTSRTMAEEIHNYALKMQAVKHHWINSSFKTERYEKFKIFNVNANIISYSLFWTFKLVIIMT